MLLIPTLSPATVFAADNDIKTNEKRNEKESSQKIKEASEASSKSQADKGHNITDEAYLMYDEMVNGFKELQINYGNLGDENMSSGYKAYLTQISKNKENSALNYKLSAQKAGKYSISSEGLVLNQDKANDLADSMFATDESKKESLKNSEESQKGNADNSSSMTIDKNVFGSQYQQSVKNNNEQFSQSKEDASKEFGQSQKLNEEKLKNSQENGQKIEKKAKDTSNAIQESYTSLKEQIKNNIKTYSEEKRIATNIKFSAKVAGFDAAKQAANPKNATLKATAPKTPSLKKSGSNSSSASTASQSSLFESAKKKAEQDFLQGVKESSSKASDSQLDPEVRISRNKIHNAIEKQFEKDKNSGK